MRITNWVCVYSFIVQAAHNLNKPVQQSIVLSADIPVKESKTVFENVDYLIYSLQELRILELLNAHSFIQCLH